MLSFNELFGTSSVFSQVQIIKKLFLRKLCSYFINKMNDFVITSTNNTFSIQVLVYLSGKNIYFFNMLFVVQGHS